MNVAKRIRTFPTEKNLTPPAGAGGYFLRKVIDKSAHL